MAILAQLWTRDYVISEDLAEKITSYLLEKMSKLRKPEDLSISYAVESIRSDLRINFPTNHSDAMTTLEALGFTVKGVPGKKNPRINRYWFVTL